jgi:hypothetical protein
VGRRLIIGVVTGNGVFEEKEVHSNPRAHRTVPIIIPKNAMNPTANAARFLRTARLSIFTVTT